MPIWPHPDEISSAKVRTLHDYWGARLNGGIAPLRTDIDPADLRELLPNIVIVDFAADPLEVRYRLIGTRVVEISRVDFTGKLLSECDFQAAESEIWRECYAQIAETGRPVYGRVEIPVDGEGDMYVVEEFGIFPLSHDGAAIHQCIALEDYGDLSRMIPTDRIRPMRVR